jgi:hypothetical protein
LICSSLLQRSKTLYRLLQYLAEHTLNSPSDHLKEYQIAIEVLGRAQDFDPQLDASVRVQVGRLRNKLDHYYSLTGINDPILIDIPKGGYNLSFERKVLQPQAEPHNKEEDIPTPHEPQKPERIRLGLFLALAFLAGALLAGVAAIYLFHRQSPQPIAGKASASRLPTAFQTFWSPFLRGPDEPMVVFSNAVFVGHGDTGLRYFDPSRDSRDQVTQHYTGVGELVGVLDLDRIFQQTGGRFRIKRGGLFTFDEARSNNLIFVGSPMENVALRQFPNTHEFVFRQVAKEDNRRGEEIVDLHPPSGKTGIYPPAIKTGGENVDYAIIALMPGLDHSRSTLVLAGLTTIGTQAAVDYVCNQGAIEELLQRLNVPVGGEMKPFEAVLRVKVTNDVPMETQLVDLRRTDH